MDLPKDSVARYDVVVNTAGLLAEDLCLALTKPEGRVVTALTQPPGLRCQGPSLGLGFGHCHKGS